MVDNHLLIRYPHNITFKRIKKMKLTTRELILVPLFTALMIAGAFVRIPFPLLPVTLQAFFCAFAGLILGPRLGAVSMAVYAALGLAGVPVFAQGGGIAYVLNKSFGFIIGFIAGAYIIGKISYHTKKPAKTGNIVAVMVGLLAIYAIGIAYMLLIIKVYLADTQTGVLFVLTANFPYFIKDAVLFTVAALSAGYILPVLSKVRT